MPSVAAPLQTIAGTAPETASAPPTVPRPAIALTTTGACNEVAFYARSADDTTAITINFDATRRSPSIETVVQFRLPDPRISVFVTHGTGLSHRRCLRQRLFADVAGKGFCRVRHDHTRPSAKRSRSLRGTRLVAPRRRHRHRRRDVRTDQHQQQPDRMRHLLTPAADQRPIVPGSARSTGIAAGEGARPAGCVLLVVGCFARTPAGRRCTQPHWSTHYLMMGRARSTPGGWCRHLIVGNRAANWCFELLEQLPQAVTVGR